jgi:hypothetical protein
MLSHTIQPSIIILADRKNDTQHVGDRVQGSMTIGKRDLVNCDRDYQFVSLFETREWMIRMVK